MTVFADPSAIVKLYVDENGHEDVRAHATLAVAQIARVEVPAAFWRKVRLGELDPVDAGVLIRDFEADYYGTAAEPPRFAVMAVTVPILDDAATLCARHPLRGFDAIQLASALAVRQIDAGITTMAVFDVALRTAAAAEGLALSPGGLPAGR